MKNNKLNICILGSTYPRFDNDHQVPWLRQAAKLLAKKGHKVTVIAPSFKGNKNHKIDGNDVLRFRYAPSKIEQLTHDEGAPSKVKSLLGKLLAISYILSGSLHMLYWCWKHKFDVVNVHWPLPHGLLVILPRLLFGTKVVISSHGAGMAMARKSKLLKCLLKLSLFSASSAMSNSSHTKSELKKLTGQDSTVIPYGATVNFKVAKKPFSNQGKVKILFSGRHIERKGVDYLIKALPEVLAKKDVELLITGAGDQTNKWKELSKSLNLEKNVKFLGFLSNEELSFAYQTCDIYCLPAIYDSKGDTEGLGVVLIEALLHARPVIASSVGGIVDIIKDNETGLLVQEKSPSSLAKSILWLIDNPLEARKLGLNGQKMVSEVFDWDKIILNIEKQLKLDLKPQLEPEAASPQLNKEAVCEV